MAPSIPAPPTPVTSPGAGIRRRSTPRWCRARAGRRRRRVRGRSGITRRRPATGGGSGETPGVATDVLRPPRRGRLVTVPAPLQGRHRRATVPVSLQGRRRPATDGGVRRENRHQATAGTVPRLRQRATMARAVPRATGRPRLMGCPWATGRAVMGAVARRARGRRVTGLPLPPVRRMVTRGPFLQVRRPGAIGRFPRTSRLAAAGGCRPPRARRLVTGVLVVRVRCPVTSGLPLPAKGLATVSPSPRVGCLGTAGRLPRMRRPAAAGRRVLRTRAPAATGRSPGADRTMAGAAPGSVGTMPAGKRGGDGTIRGGAPGGTRGADGNSLVAVLGGGMTAVRIIRGRRLRRGGVGATAAPVTSPVGRRISTLTGAAGRAAVARPHPMRAGMGRPRPGRVGMARRPRRTRRRGAAGDTGPAIRGGRHPARSWKAAWFREPRPGRAGVSSTVTATP